MEAMTEITGYARPHGTFGIRNHVLVLATVSCVTGVIQRIAREVPEAVCVPHAWGCGRGGPRDMQVLLRVLSGMVHHSNVGAVVLIGLGCEVSNTRTLTAVIGDAGKPIESFNVQEDGGSLATASKGAAHDSGHQRRADPGRAPRHGRVHLHDRPSAVLIADRRCVCQTCETRPGEEGRSRP